VSYLKKILGELAMVLDQIEAELEKRKLENEGRCHTAVKGSAHLLALPTLSIPSLFLPETDPRALPAG
jgi:hypothetical protein